MRQILLCLFIFLCTFFLLQCSSEEPTQSSEVVEFVVTATDFVPQFQSNVGDWLAPTDYLNLVIEEGTDHSLPQQGDAVCFIEDPRPLPQDPSQHLQYPPRPVSIEFKPEFKVYQNNSTSFQVATVDIGSPNDPEYFGRTPFDTVCIDAMKSPQEANPNNRFSITADEGKVVGLFRKKLYTDQYSWRNDATLKVDVYVDGSILQSYQTSEQEGSLTIIVPVR